MTDLSKFDAPPPRASEPEWGREDFLNTLVGTLSETIEQVVGLNDAETFIGMVGRRMGQSAAARLPCQGKATPEEVAEHLKSFKASIGGTFEVESVDGSKLTFTNSHCPFASEVNGRPSLCMMTTNVFGRVAADATGYARVNVVESLARGHGRCLVKVNLEWEDDGDGQEFFG
ncbi:methanogen output domain 1-containing protein [Pseudooceanicola onchidii]|uniref:methanogen output domain 1-containing protein n=1 Tax=Pseudooceanicola onchidii TaxID=2562279 RepID=UPI0010AA0DB4|nr:methanogen output domain 1-containing protein [Pseudooceanicola onchidii]